jgi:hypothetical protein
MRDARLSAIRRLVLQGMMAVLAATIPNWAAAQQAAAASPAAVIEREHAALNRHDVDDALAVYADTLRFGQLVDSTVSGPSSKTALRQFLVPFYAKHPHSRVVVAHEIIVGSFVADDARLTGTSDGAPFQMLDLSEIRRGHVVEEVESTNLAPVSSADAHAALAVVRRADDAFARGDDSTAATQFADPVLFHTWGDTVVRRISHADMRAGFAKVLATNPKMRYTVVDRMVVGPFVVDHERLVGMADGHPRDALNVMEVRDGRIVAEWETVLDTGI